jgi:hypothetical protein
VAVYALPGLAGEAACRGVMVRYLALLLYVVLVAVGYVLWFVADRVDWLHQRLTRIKRRYQRVLESVYEWTL